MARKSPSETKGRDDMQNPDGKAEARFEGYPFSFPPGFMTGLAVALSLDYLRFVDSPARALGK